MKFQNCSSVLSFPTPPPQHSPALPRGLWGQSLTPSTPLDTQLNPNHTSDTETRLQSCTWSQIWSHKGLRHPDSDAESLSKSFYINTGSCQGLLAPHWILLTAQQLKGSLALALLLVPRGSLPVQGQGGGASGKIGGWAAVQLREAGVVRECLGYPYSSSNDLSPPPKSKSPPSPTTVQPRICPEPLVV